MSLRFLPLAVATLALVFASGNASAQGKKAKRSDARVVPVLNRDSLKLEAVLLLEPATGGHRRRRALALRQDHAGSHLRPADR